MVIDHVSIGVCDLARARAFYDAVLAPLGVGRTMDFDTATGYGSGHPWFWIGLCARPEAAGTGCPGVHVAFAAPNRTAVDSFYRAALAAGGTDNGAPGLRLHYHPDYYAAFVIDPDGNRIEAVCHAPAG